KASRKSALSKLETTEAELTRVDDIISEVQKNVNVLARQVGKARRYHEYKQALAENDRILAYLKIHAYEHDLKPLRSEMEEVTRSRDTLGAEVHQQEADLEKHRSESIETEQLYRKKSAAFFQKEERIKDLKNRQQLREQRIESLEESIRRYRDDIEEQRQKIAELENEEKTLGNTLAQTTAEMAKAQEHYRGSANEQLKAEEAYQKIRDDYQDFVQNNMQEIQASGTLKEAYQKIRIEKENLVSRRDRNQSVLERLQGELKERSEALESAESEAEGVREDLNMYQQESAHLEKSVGALKERLDSLRQEINQLQGAQEKLRSRRDFLENLIKNYEGFSQSVQYVMSQKSRFGGVQDTLANLVDCEEQYRPALESYLSEVANYLVVDEVANAREILGNLRSENKGRLTVVPLNFLEARAQNGKLPDGKDGAVRPLLEVVNFPDAYRRLFEVLLGGVYLAADIDAAITLRKDYPQLTYVTLEGEILEHWGNITGGTRAKQVGLIGRKEQFQKVSADLTKLEEQLADREDALVNTGDELQGKEAKQREFATLQKETQASLTELEKKLNNLGYEVNRIRESAAELEGELTELSGGLERLEKEEAELLPQLAEQDARVKAYHEKEKALQESQRAAEAEVRRMTQETQNRQISYLNLTAREKEINQQKSFVSRGIEEAGGYIRTRERDIENGTEQIQTLRNELEEVAVELEGVFEDRDAAEVAKNEIEKQFQEYRTAIQNAEVELKKRQRLWGQARERLQELELRIREYEVKLAGVREQLEERHGAEALKFDIGELPTGLTVGGVQNTIDDLRRKLEGLGEVNPLAIKEHEKEKERLDFLNTQRDDLLSAKTQLMETIEKLNTTARRQFMEVFEKIQVNFQRVFQEFFEGGVAVLKLVESRDPLEANIDFEIAHKGKKINTLTLLSAGEKTLTAISLLFAIYLVKPSPFCILDEVDAPLDDVNIGRLMQALRLFARDTQFILVTHNKKTMEATNQIYGITMEEKGVSKVVSVKFD
nr:chromosome segregation protein SMC [Calditrichia bacterium]